MTGHERQRRIADRVVITHVSEPTDDDYRELARIIRRIHARTAAQHERERLAAGAEPCQCEVCEWMRRSERGRRA